MNRVGIGFWHCKQTKQSHSGKTRGFTSSLAYCVLFSSTRSAKRSLCIFHPPLSPLAHLHHHHHPLGRAVLLVVEARELLSAGHSVCHTGASPSTSPLHSSRFALLLLLISLLLLLSTPGPIVLVPFHLLCSRLLFPLVLSSLTLSSSLHLLLIIFFCSCGHFGPHSSSSLCFALPRLASSKVTPVDANQRNSY